MSPAPLHLFTQAHCQLAALCCSPFHSIVLHHSFIEEHSFYFLLLPHISCWATPLHTYTQYTSFAGQLTTKLSAFALTTIFQSTKKQNFHSHHGGFWRWCAPLGAARPHHRYSLHSRSYRITSTTNICAGRSIWVLVRRHPASGCCALQP